MILVHVEVEKNIRTAAADKNYKNCKKQKKGSVFTIENKIEKTEPFFISISFIRPFQISAKARSA